MMDNIMDIADKPMIATKAYHKLGNLSRKQPGYCIVNKEDADNFYGHWVEGLGFIDVRFPKDTTRELTPEELKDYNSKVVVIDYGFWDRFREYQKQKILNN